MKNILPALLASVLCSLVVPTPTARAQGTALTYQGRLHDAAGPASGTYNFQFTVHDALTGGSPVGVNPLAAMLDPAPQTCQGPVASPENELADSIGCS